MKKTYATTDYDGCGYITAGKMYEVLNDCGFGFGVTLIGDNGARTVLADRVFNWTRVEMEEAEALAHNAKLERSKALDEQIESLSASGIPECMDKARKLAEQSMEDTTPDTPKTFGKLTDVEKGALLLAGHNGETIDLLTDEGWLEAFPPGWVNEIAYRIKPQPVVKEVILRGYLHDTDGWAWGSSRSKYETHRITFTTHDGKPVLDSIKIEEV